MRILLKLLLCLALLFQGNAFARLTQTPCPMGQTGALESVIEAMDDCFNDADTRAMTGQLCKTAQDCGLFPFGILVSPCVVSIRAGLTQWRPTMQARPSSVERAGIWRPPTTV